MRLTTALPSTLFLLAFSSSLPADEPARKPDSPMVKLLRGGKVPAERQGTVIDMIGKRGTAEDMSFLLEQATGTTSTFTPANRLRALEALSEAALTRNVRPEGEGDLGRLAPMVEGKGQVDPAARREAIRLAGLWKAESLGPALRSIAAEPGTSEPLRAASLDALAAIGGKEGRASIEALTAAGKPLKVRALAVAALARLDAAAAADSAASVLNDAAKGATQDDLMPMLAAFLNRRGGPETLASAIGRSKVPVPADAARLALRAVYTLGHSDPALVSALTRAAGLDAEVKPLDQPAMDRLIAEVGSKGDPARGEATFRRADLNCTRCHALSGAGGGVGPDLSALGSSSPVDYIINSIMLPDQAIKEEFHTLVVVTNDGQIFQGIVADKDDKRVVLKEATGELRTIPASEIDDSKEGGSLMPKGLVNFMTRAEFIDIVRFLSELGKPGPYAIRSSPTIQRWRYLKPVPEPLAKSVPDASTFRAQVLNADPAHWLPAYARTAGELPLDELAADAGSVLYLQGEVEVSHGDKVAVKLNSTEGATAWVDDQAAPAFSGSEFLAELSAGRHKLTFRIVADSRLGAPLKVEVLKPAGSSAEYAVVGGR